MTRTTLLAALSLFLAGSFATAQDRPPGKMQDRPSLGVLIEQAGRPQEHPGARIMQVMPESPAAKAGLLPGDLITKLGDQQIKDYSSLTSTLEKHKSGDQVKVVIMRGNEEKTVTVTLTAEPRRAFGQDRPDRPRPQPGQSDRPGNRPGDRPMPPRGDRPMQPPVMLGVQMQPLTPDIKDEVGVSVDSGVVIAGVMPQSPAEKAGLRRGDVVVSFEGKEVSNPEDLHQAVVQAGHKEVTLKIARGKDTKEVKAKLEAPPMEPGMEPRMFPPGDPRMEIQRLQERINQLERRLAELEKKIKE
jgi:S1-C subfamily serine protease